MSYKRMWSCLALVLFASVPVFAQDTQTPEPQPEPEQPPFVQLRGVTWNGPGCRVSPTDPFPEIVIEGNTMKFYAPPFVTQFGPGVSIAENRKNCIMTLDIAVPEGWSYAFDTFEMHGYMDLDAGVKGEISQTHFFEGGPTSGKRSATWVGPKHTDIVLKDKVGLEGNLWSPCNLQRKLSFNTALRLSKVDSKTSPNATGYLSLDQGIYQQQYGFIWKKC